MLGERVVTPPLEDGPLAGITRDLVIRWGREAGIEIVEEPLSFDVLTECDEAFLTSSTRNVQGIHAINERQLGEEGTPGRVTARLAEVFSERQDELLS